MKNLGVLLAVFLLGMLIAYLANRTKYGPLLSAPYSMLRNGMTLEEVEACIGRSLIVVETNLALPDDEGVLAESQASYVSEGIEIPPPSGWRQFTLVLGFSKKMKLVDRSITISDAVSPSEIIK